jgi:hypothetical protein
MHFLKVREYEKQIWFITYASGSSDLTPELLHEANIQCDECYTITWRESKYTLIHLDSANRMRLPALKTALQKLHTDHGIITSFISGYDTLSCNTLNEDQKVFNHPGFQKMVELLNKKRDEVRIWLKNGEISTYRKGLLWKYIESTDHKKKTHGQLVEQVLKMTSKMQEYEELKSANQALQAALSAECSRSETFYNELLERNQECHALRMRLIALNADHTWNPN